jgi:hypothetical protein
MDMHDGMEIIVNANNQTQQTMINSYTMKHFVYKTTHRNGKYYVGRHSTTNINDGYIGSGRWVRQVKDKTELTREILEYANTPEELILLEERYLKEHYGKPDCMNMSNAASGWATGEAHPMNIPDVAEKISGDNHWTRKNPDSLEKISGNNHWLRKDTERKHSFVRSSKILDGTGARTAYERGTHNSITNNPSTVNAMNGTHHWQNGKSPNYQGKLNKKLVEEGRHNFLGPDLNKQRIEAGTHNFLGAEANLRRLAEGTHPSQIKKTCAHCGKSSSVGMYKRWHGDNCKRK